jgi:hypothetical protein
LNYSEEDGNEEAMDEDNIPVVDANDLAQYKLDDYDEDGPSSYNFTRMR